MKKIIAIIGARPQFIKHFPFEQEAVKSFDLKTIHTGQHYDDNMSKIFFDELGMTKPHYQLEIGSGSHGAQTGKMLAAIEEIVLAEQPVGMVVYGDTNSTLAGALVASKLHIPLFHIEAGLRSFNKKMPEEVNRILTDHCSDLLFATSQIAINNLALENITDRVIMVGDIMKDIARFAIKEKRISPLDYDFPFYYATIHRPYNTDEKNRLTEVINTLNGLDKKVIFAIHPRTRNTMKRYGMEESDFSNVLFIDPQSYFSNLSYLYQSDALITDSGGMQKEAYWMKTKCITIRTETEWIETIQLKGNTLVFEDLSKIQHLLAMPMPQWDENLYGDGNAAEHICTSIQKYFSNKGSI